MSDVTPQPTEADRDRTTTWDRWRRIALTGLLMAASVAIALAIEERGEHGRGVQFEPAAAIGKNPFMTTGLMDAPKETSSTTTKPGLYGGSGSQKVCNPQGIVDFLDAHPAKAAAWVGALNADPTLSWSGGNHLTVSQIGAYIAELTPTFLAVDTLVLNHGYLNGVATPHLSILAAGTAVLVDGHGQPRSRCACGNPLGPPDTGTTTTTEKATSTTEVPTTVTAKGCTDLPPVVAAATNVSTAPVDFDGDGTADVLRVYRVGTAWHVRAEIGGHGVDDEVIVGQGPTMAAIGGATVNSDNSQEAWVNLGTGGASFGTEIGLYTFAGCDLERVEGTTPGAPAVFETGLTPNESWGVTCLSGNGGLQVFTTTSGDSTTYSGTSQIMTLVVNPSPPHLVLQGAATSVSASNSPGGPAFDKLTQFTCDGLGPNI